MPVTLPTFADLPAGNPRAVPLQPTYLANDPLAEGEAKLGAGIAKAGQATETVAAYDKIAQVRMDRAMADANFYSTAGGIDAQLKTETDPEKVTALGQQYQEALATAGSAIRDPDARALWMAHQAQHVAVGQKGAELRNVALYRDQYKANVADQTEGVIRTAASQDDPRGFEFAQQRIADLATAGQQSGSFTAVEAHHYASGATKQLVAGKAGYLVNSGRPDDALKFLDDHATDLDPVTLETLRARAQAKGNKITTDGAALRALNLPTVGAGNQPAGYLPDMGNLRIGGAIPHAIANEANRAGVNPTTALATAQIESSMGRNLGSRGNIFQLGQPEWASVGGGAMADAGTQIRNGIAFLGNTEQDLSDKLGRPATQAEVYLAHQQGVAGATRLINHPDTPAGQLVGDAAISNNHGDPNAPASQFVGHWQNVFNRTAAGIGTAMPSAAAPPASNVEVWGDSLGVGLKGQLKSGGTAVGGATPSAIFDNIKAQPADYWQGKTVVLPSGSNGNQMPIVEDTVKYLKDNGASVIAVGYGPKFPEKNAALAEIAQRQQIPVVAAEGVGASEGVHPSPQGYRTMAQKIGALSVPTTPAPGPDQLAGQAPPATAPSAVPSLPQGRTALPSLAEAYMNILRDPSIKTDAQQEAAFRTATAVHNAFEAQAAQAERIAAGRAKAALEGRTNEIYADVYSPNPKITPQQVAVDPAFDSNPERRKAMIELINNPPGSGIPAAQSYKAAQALIDRIRLPYGNPDKITTPDEIYANVRSLNRPDLEFALKTLNDSILPGNEKFAQREREFIAGVKPLVDKSNPLMGKIDESGPSNLYRLQWDLDRKIEEYRKANKDPSDLFDPRKPEYFGSPANILQYQKTLQESIKDKVKALIAAPVAAAVAALPAAVVPQRNRGESGLDYLSRAGILPSAPATPAQPSVPIR